MRAIELFVRLYGAEAGNLALKMMATGGLYIGGGIAAKNLPFFQTGTFLEAFLAKGRMRPLLEAMPVRILLNDQTALLGAARCAAMRGAAQAHRLVRSEDRLGDEARQTPVTDRGEMAVARQEALVAAVESAPAVEEG